MVLGVDETVVFGTMALIDFMHGRHGGIIRITGWKASPPARMPTRAERRGTMWKCPESLPFSAGIRG
jgi:hypothetical protein